MMRWIFWLLLLVNLLFFALMQWGSAWTGYGKNLQLQPPLNAEKIKLVSAPVASPPAVAQPPVVAQPPSGAPPALVEPSPAVVPPTVVEPRSGAQSTIQATDACMEWGEFSGDDLARATAALDALKLGDKVTQRQIERTSGYWVYMPPRKTRAEVDKKIAQLNALGVEEHFVVQEAGKWRNAISLGVFKTEEAAQKFLKDMKSKGVRSAMVGARQSKFTLTLFVLKNLDAETTAKVTALQNEFAGSELKAVACGN